MPIASSKEPTMLEDGKPRSSDRRTVTERHADTAYIDTHNNTLFRAWCRAVGLSEDEITRIVSETGVDKRISADRKMK